MEMTKVILLLIFLSVSSFSSATTPIFLVSFSGKNLDVFNLEISVLTSNIYTWKTSIVSNGAFVQPYGLSIGQSYFIGSCSSINIPHIAINPYLTIPGASYSSNITGFDLSLYNNSLSLGSLQGGSLSGLTLTNGAYYFVVSNAVTGNLVGADGASIVITTVPESEILTLLSIGFVPLVIQLSRKKIVKNI